MACKQSNFAPTKTSVLNWTGDDFSGKPGNVRNFALVREMPGNRHVYVREKSCQGKLLECMHGMGSWHWQWHD